MCSQNRVFRNLGVIRGTLGGSPSSQISSIVPTPSKGFLHYFFTVRFELSIGAWLCAQHFVVSALLITALLYCSTLQPGGFPPAISLGRWLSLEIEEFEKPYFETFGHRLWKQTEGQNTWYDQSESVKPKCPQERENKQREIPGKCTMI